MVQIKWLPSTLEVMKRSRVAIDGKKEIVTQALESAILEISFRKRGESLIAQNLEIQGQLF